MIEDLEGTASFVKIRRVLKPSGHAVISTNNLASWHSILSLIGGMQLMPCHVSDKVVLGNNFDPNRGRVHGPKGFAHLLVFSYRALRELVEFHGLRGRGAGHIGYYPFAPRIADVLCRVDPRHGRTYRAGAPMLAVADV